MFTLQTQEWAGILKSETKTENSMFTFQTQECLIYQGV